MSELRLPLQCDPISRSEYIMVQSLIKQSSVGFVGGFFPLVPPWTDETRKSHHY